MGPVLEVLLLRLLVWVGVPLFLIAIAIGPSRTWRIFRRVWAWVDDRRHEPTEVLNRVVSEHEKSIRQLKDVLSQTEAAQAEMHQKLARAGKGGASIPVIDIMGQILIGYSPAALDQAIRTAEGAKAL